MGRISGNIARISDLHIFENGDRSRTVVYLTVIENHDKSDGNGGRTPAGRTVYDVSFSIGQMAERVRGSFNVGDPVLIWDDDDKRRTSLNTSRANGEPEPVIKAYGLDIGLSCRYAKLCDLSVPSASAAA
ncbi:hypothetical protein [Nocardia sp. CA-120079]|uniref:hypothetical protein n=1 Tax=Nocardia sp. CA-120079 TaxID=3239974 RepID=UPI003D95617A